MYKVVLLFVIVSTTACSGATSSTGGRAKAPTPVTAGPVDVQIQGRHSGSVHGAIAALHAADKEFVELYTARVVPGNKTVADLDTGTTVLSDAHMSMDGIRLGATLVHEACHHWQWYSGKVANGSIAEAECAAMQAEAEARVAG